MTTLPAQHDDTRQICVFSKKFVYTFAVALILTLTSKVFFMFINDNCFNEWMEKLFNKMTELCKNQKLLINTHDVFENDDKPLDNQEVSQLLHVSHRTLQRYRSDGLLPFFKLGQKIYYKTSDVREFIYKNGDYWDTKQFDDKMLAK